MNRYGYNIGAEAPARRTGLTAELAPVLAPATGGFTARVDLDPQQRLHAEICVDGKCYQTSIDLAPAIAAVMAKIAQAHMDMHAAMPHGAPMISGEVMLDTVDEAIGAASDALIDSLVDRHISVACAGFLDDIGNAVSDIGSAVKGAGVSVYRGVTETVQKLKGPITAVATGVATVYGGPAAGAAAAKLVGPIVDSAANLGKDGPQKAAAEDAAKTDPAAAQALAAAKDAVAHTVAAYHVVETAKKAAAGHPEAQQAIAKVTQDAESGDPAAHAATDLIQNAFSTAITARQRSAPRTYQTAPASYRQPASAAYPTAPAEYRRPDTYRQTASRAVERARRQYQGSVAALGYVRLGKHHKVYFFNSPDEAQGWYGSLAPGYSYAALFDARNVTTPIAENFGGEGTTTSGVGAWQEIVGGAAGW
jgi:hypothetical protein